MGGSQQPEEPIAMQRLKGIIITLLGMTLLGAAYWLLSASLLPSTQITSEKQSGETKALSVQLSEVLKSNPLTDEERYIMERAAAEWPRDPFEKPRPSVSPETAPGKTAAPTSAYVYSGYVEVDKKKLAIINGTQYQVGDLLESGRYAIRSIESEKVVLENVGKQGVTILPFVGGGF